MKIFGLILCLLTALITHAQLPNYIPQTGLVAWFNFNGNAADESPYSNDGVVYGAVPTADRYGNPTSALQFTDVDSVVVQHDSSLNFEGFGDFTLSYWLNINSTSFSQDHIIVSKQTDDGTDQDGWNHRLSPNHSLYTSFANGIGTSNCTAEDESALFTQGFASHIVHVYTDGEVKTYVDNNLTSTTSCSAIVGNNLSNLVIGNASWGSLNTTGFNGILDDLGLWNRALHECEIQDLWFATDPTPMDLTVSESGGTLTANQSGITQWVDCDNGYSSIPGASGQSFTPTTSGNYAAEISPFFGCVFYTECTYVKVVGLDELSSKLFRLYPNPSNGSVTLEYITDVFENMTYSVTDITGKVVLQSVLGNGNTTTVDLNHKENGVYFLSINEQVIRFVKEE